MGIENRDYARDEPGSGGGVGGFMSDTPSCKKIILATVAFYLLQIFLVRDATEDDFQAYLDAPGIAEAGEAEREDVLREFLQYSPKISIVETWCVLDTEKVVQGQVWRLVTTALLHDRSGVLHILFNMLFLYWFGRSLESQYGSREFMIFYVSAAIIASIAFIGIQLATGERNPAIGASGAVMAVVCLFAMWNPGYTLHLYFVFPIRIIWLLAFYVISDLHPVLLALAGTQTSTGIAHAAHLGGLAFGYLYWRGSWSLEPLVSAVTPKISVNRFAQQRPTRVSPRKQTRDEQFDHTIDEILAKISIQGESSLTNEERKLLHKASDRYRNRRS